MAIARMTKFMIVTHRSESVDVLDALQEEGIAQVLDAEGAMVSKDWPELQVEAKRPRDLEEMVSRLDKAIDFLKDYAGEEANVSAFSPLVAVEKTKYSDVIAGKEAIELLEYTEAAESDIERLETEHENLSGKLDALGPWKSLETPVEEIGELRSASCFTGLLPDQYFDEVTGKLTELGAAFQKVGPGNNARACIVACLTDAAGDVQKILRSGDFETVSFEGMTGTVADLISDCKSQLSEIETGMADAEARAGELAKDRLDLQILYDYYQNMLNREVARSVAPATDSTVLLEGWVREKDYAKLEEIISGFEASSVGRMDIAEGEVPPVEIDNNAAVQPFESITRLYGMPSVKDVDPTACLAPFFAIFFGLCLTDAIYGIVLFGLLWWMLKKMQGDKKFIRMFLVCSVFAVAAGAATGSWCGDAIEKVLPAGSAIQNAAISFRDIFMQFDPMADPMTFFKISLGLGYVQIIVGLCIALYNNLRLKDYASAMFEQVTWLIMLNSLLVLGLSKGGVLPGGLARICGIIAIVQAVLIFLFTERKSGMVGRLGGGVFALFSTVFYFGDVLSYVRLMALGMVTGGLGMAVNILSKLLMDSGKLGFVFGLLLFVGGHMFNLAMGVLSAFVHSLRLQFVEFFPKFLAGGGRDFIPLRQQYKHVLIKRK